MSISSCRPSRGQRPLAAQHLAPQHLVAQELSISKNTPHGRWGQGPGSVDPRFPAGLPFPVPEIREFVAFRDSGKIFQQFSRSFPGTFLQNSCTDPGNSHSLLEFSEILQLHTHQLHSFNCGGINLCNACVSLVSACLASMISQKGNYTTIMLGELISNYTHTPVTHQ